MHGTKIQKYLSLFQYLKTIDIQLKEIVKFKLITAENSQTTNCVYFHVTSDFPILYKYIDRINTHSFLKNALIDI